MSAPDPVTPKDPATAHGPATATAAPEALETPSEKAARATLAGLISLTAGLLSYVAILRYRAALSDWAFDLAFFHNLVANAAAGYGFTQTASTHELNGLVNLSHAFFAMPLLVPIYRLFPHLETLLIVQATVLALGAWPAARLARRAGATAWTATGVAALYLACMPLWRLGLADFRFLISSISALLWLADALTAKDRRVTIIATLAVCLLREELPILAPGLALGLWLSRRTDRGNALLTLSLATVYFALLFWIRPRMGYYVAFDHPDILLGSIHLEVPAGAPRGPRFLHLADYLAPGLWPGVLEPLVLLASLPLVAYQFLMSSYEWWRWDGPYVHHTAPLLAFSTTAAALGWGRLERLLRARTVRASLLLALVFAAAIGFEARATWHEVTRVLRLRDGREEIALRLEHQQAFDALLARIPGDARVATDYHLIARLSGRRWLYCYQTGFGPPHPGQPAAKDRPGLAQVDWLLIAEEHPEWIELLEAAGDFRREASGGGYRLYRRSGGSP